ncbi:MAG: AAA family ATPase, partial [bacterium]|nr:AAA family ATPase [bacterium]
MKRDLQEFLQLWRRTDGRKPLLLRGARQVGKSWLARELGKEFKFFAEINFEKSPELCSFFDGNLDVKKIARNIASYIGIPIVPNKTLLLLDEIQECPRAILALRYFREDFPELHVIAAGSLLEFQLQNVSTPVGRITFVHVYPLSFSEYLGAIGKENLRFLLLENKFKPLPDPIHNLLLLELRNYTLLGGMPEVVFKYIEHHDFLECMNLQTGLLATYRTDFKKYAKKHQVKYLQKVFD